MDKKSLKEETLQQQKKKNATAGTESLRLGGVDVLLEWKRGIVVHWSKGRVGWYGALEVPGGTCRADRGCAVLRLVNEALWNRGERLEKTKQGRMRAKRKRAVSVLCHRNSELKRGTEIIHGSVTTESVLYDKEGSRFCHIERRNSVTPSLKQGDAARKATASS